MFFVDGREASMALANRFVPVDATIVGHVEEVATKLGRPIPQDSPRGPMKIAEVIGTVVAPIQHPFYAGRTLPWVQPLDAAGRAKGRALVAVDRARAGIGDRVLVLDEGSSARDLFG